MGSVVFEEPSHEEAKEATDVTTNSNRSALNNLPFADERDFTLASRGFVDSLPEMMIRDSRGRVVWNLKRYNFIRGDAPAEVHPSLWRNALLNMHHGLFKVQDRIYQLRGYDLSNMTIIEGDSGLIVIDTLMSIEVAKAAMDLYFKHRPKRTVAAVILTHSHGDHYGGVKGVVSEADVKAGKVRVIAPKGFVEELVSESVLAGNVMKRRATYHDGGGLLSYGTKGQVDSGIGKATSLGTMSLIEPTDTIDRTGKELNIDGVRIVFQLTPNAEAPAEMNLFFPQLKALCLAENANSSLHNVSTPRGAPIRNARGWAYYLKEALELFGENTEVLFTTHFWPRWGKEEITEFIVKQAAVYKYIHDQTLRLANHGYTALEIAEKVKLPESLEREWYNHGYYGTVSHNTKAVYHKYLGWFDGNPANLNPLPPEESGKKYVEFMGGSEQVIAKSERAFARGEYRWVVQVMNHVVFSDPQNRKARHLAADALEQLGYQSESASWRNFYLGAARELRHGVTKSAIHNLDSSDVVKTIPLGLLWDSLAVRLNGPKANGKVIKLNFELTDTRQNCAVTVENSVLDCVVGTQLEEADAHVTITRAVLNEIALGKTVEERIENGEVKVSGNREKLEELLSLLDKFAFWFNIAEP